VADGKNYHILELVATGGTAVLYKAIQASLDRVVAVKKLHHHLTDDENFTRRFILEAKAAASLDHQNIVQIIDFGLQDDSYNMVMEFIEGESLRQTIDKWKRIPIDMALALVHQVCLGLEHAHTKGIVHRDIKPSNIMLTRSGRVKITDFGLAKLTQTTTQHTAANSILGTPLYMSPEQAFGESVDQRSDLFSLGTMLYEMITGHQPFRDENYMGVIQNIINKNIPHPSKFDVDIPPPVATIILKAMNKNRDGRFQDAGAFRKAIEDYLDVFRLKEVTDNLKILLKNDEATVILSEMTPTSMPRRRRRRGILVTLAAAVLLGGAWIGFTVPLDSIKEKTQDLLSGGRSGPRQPYEKGQIFEDDIYGSWLSPVSADTTEPAGVAWVDSSETAVQSSGAAPDTALVATPALVARPDSLSQGAEADTFQAAEIKDGNKDAARPDPPPIPVQVAKHGWLSVTAEPWAEIYIDGRYRGDTPPLQRIELTGGTHTLECRNPTHEVYKEVLKITTGEMSRRSIVLQKLFAKIDLQTLEGAEIYVDGMLVGTAPLEAPIELDAGRHLVTVKKPGFNVWNNTITLEANNVMRLNITLSPMY
jgi:serine/threonine protein kinase